MEVGDGSIKTFAPRGVKDNPPYLHDQRLLTLDDAVEFFNLILSDKMTAQRSKTWWRSYALCSDQDAPGRPPAKRPAAGGMESLIEPGGNSYEPQLPSTSHSRLEKRVGGIALWQRPQSIPPVSITIRPPLITTRPPTIIIKRPITTTSVSTKRRRSTQPPLSNIASKVIRTRRPPTNNRTNKDVGGGDDDVVSSVSS